MGIQSLKGNSGTDWSKYTSKSLLNATLPGVSSASGEVNLLNITGNGFFKYLHASIPVVVGAPSENLTVKLYIDGTLVFSYTTSGTSTKYIALSMRDLIKVFYNSTNVPTYLFPYNSGGYNTVPNGTPKYYGELPINGTDTNGNMYGVIEGAIPFATSLRVTVSQNANSATISGAVGYALKTS